MQKYILIKNRTRSNSLRNVVYDPRAHKYYNNKKYCANVMYNILIIYNDVNTIQHMKSYYIYKSFSNNKLELSKWYAVKMAGGLTTWNKNMGNNG